MTKVYVVVELGWDHHVIKSVHSQEIDAEIAAALFKDKQPYYSYDLEEFYLDET